MNQSIANGKTGGVSGFVLKMTALITMLIDHVGATVVSRTIDLNYGWYDPDYSGLVTFYSILRDIGRIAFPIFCYLLVEGFLHTRSKQRYALRLAVFVLISEVPFDLAFNGTLMDLTGNNVFLTLLIGLLTIWGMDEIGKRFRVNETFYGKKPEEEETDTPMNPETGEKRNIPWERVIPGILLMLLAAVLGMAAAELLYTDYSSGGVLAIILFYVFRKNRVVAAVAAIFSLGATCGSIELFALVSLPLYYLYNGTRGPQIKYFFYVFYPVHLLLLSLLCYLMGLDMMLY